MITKTYLNTKLKVIRKRDVISHKLKLFKMKFS